MVARRCRDSAVGGPCETVYHAHPPLRLLKRYNPLNNGTFRVRTPGRYRVASLASQHRAITLFASANRCRAHHWRINLPRTATINLTSIFQLFPPLCMAFLPLPTSSVTQRSINVRKLKRLPHGGHLYFNSQRRAKTVLMGQPEKSSFSKLRTSPSFHSTTVNFCAPSNICSRNTHVPPDFDFHHPVPRERGRTE